jgi:hypothetical protein
MTGVVKLITDTSIVKPKLPRSDSKTLAGFSNKALNR